MSNQLSVYIIKPQILKYGDNSTGLGKSVIESPVADPYVCFMIKMTFPISEEINELFNMQSRQLDFYFEKYKVRSLLHTIHLQNLQMN